MKDLNTKSPKDLMKLINEKREALKDFRFGNAGAKVKNVKEGRNLRKDIARIMTALTVISKANVDTVAQTPKVKAPKAEKTAKVAKVSKTKKVAA